MTLRIVVRHAAPPGGRAHWAPDHPPRDGAAAGELHDITENWYDVWVSRNFIAIRPHHSRRRPCRLRLPKRTGPPVHRSFRADEGAGRRRGPSTSSPVLVAPRAFFRRLPGEDGPLPPFVAPELLNERGEARLKHRRPGRKISWSGAGGLKRSPGGAAAGDFGKEKLRQSHGPCAKGEWPPPTAWFAYPRSATATKP